MCVSFEDGPSHIQDLTFDRINRLMIEKKLPNMDRLTSLQTTDGAYSNHALFLSDQCPWHIRFTSDDETMVFDGPLPVQLEGCYEHIRGLAPFISVIGRVGKYKRFPSAAVLESLVNAIMHFDASTGDDIIVTMTEKVITITNPGGLLTPDEWTDYVSTNPRNRRLAKLLVDMKLASLSGKGMNIIKSNYNSSGMIPTLEYSNDRFVVRLPALDSHLRIEEGKEVVLQYLQEKKWIKIAEMSSDLMMSVYTVKKIVGALENDGRVLVMGRGASKTIFLTNRMDNEDGLET